MNQALKQRLVGAVVLVALAVIFLPAVFNGGRYVQTDALKEVPPAPPVATLVIEAPTRAQANADQQALPASEMFAMEPKPLSTIEKIQDVTRSVTGFDKPGLDSKNHPKAWVLQVGVFSDKNKADALKKQLQAKNYRAFCRYRKNVTHVMIGPDIEQSAVVKLKAAVDKEFSVKSIVVKFEP
jgi:DedD protein